MLKAWAAFAVVATTVVTTGALAATSLPAGKSGLWVVSQTAPNGKTFTSRICSDETTQADMLTIVTGLYKPTCGRLNITADGSQVLVDAVCNMGATVLASKSVITYSGDSAFHVENDNNYFPAFLGKTETHGAMDGQWQGSCPFGMTPGDMVGPTGYHAHFSSAGAHADAR